MTGCNADEFEITNETSSMSPAVIAIMKAQEPWQWMIALIVSAPVRSLTACTAVGMSSTAASSSVYLTAGRSMLDRQLSTQTSKPLADNTFSRFCVGGLKILARVPVPAIINTGSPAVCFAGARCLRLRVRPSPAGNSWVSKRSIGIGTATTCPLVDVGAALATCPPSRHVPSYSVLGDRGDVLRSPVLAFDEATTSASRVRSATSSFVQAR